MLNDHAGLVDCCFIICQKWSAKRFRWCWLTSCFICVYLHTAFWRLEHVIAYYFCLIGDFLFNEYFHACICSGKLCIHLSAANDSWQYHSSMFTDCCCHSNCSSVFVLVTFLFLRVGVYSFSCFFIGCY